MTLDRMQLSAQTVRDNIAIMEECKEPDDAGYYLQLEHEKFVLSCIEKRIPKKPKILKVREVSGYKYGNCECGEHIMDDEKFCSNCGAPRV